MAGKVTTLTTESWEEELAACKGLAVVKFWAPWCRTCKAIAPKYEQVVFDYLEEEDVQFFQINFKEAGALCLSQRVMALPTIHFYLPEIGRVARFVVDARTANKKIALELDRFLGEDGKLEDLRDLQKGGREAMVRYTDVMRMLQALAAGRSAVPSDEEDKVFASRYAALASDEAWLRDLERLFNWLDADSSGNLDAQEVQAAIDVLNAQAKRGPAGDDAPSAETSDDATSSDADDETDADADAAAPSLAELRSMGAEALLASAAAAAPEPSGGSYVLDFASFVRLMTSQAVAELSMPEGQGMLREAFEALDTDGDGKLSMAEVLGAVSDVCELLPNGSAQLACEDASVVEDAFDAFDSDKSGAIDYEEFVAMVSGRGINDGSAVYDEFVASRTPAGAAS